MDRRLPYFFQKKSSTRFHVWRIFPSRCILCCFFVPTDMPDDDPGNRYDHKKRCKCHGHRISDDRQQQLVRPQGFYPEPANPIPCQIQQKDFPIKPLVFSKQDQKDQKNQIPQGFIEKRGMYLDIRDTIYFHHVLQGCPSHPRIGRQKAAAAWQTTRPYNRQMPPC